MLDRLPRLCLVVPLAIAVAGFSAGCGEDEESKSGEAKAVNIELSQPSKGQYEIKAPKSVEAGLVEVSFKNSDKAEHEAGFVRVEGNRTAEDVLKAIEQSEEKGIPGWLQDGGGVGATKGGATQKVTETLAPGKYVVFDSEAGSKGAAAEFEVTGEKEDAKVEVPKADAKVTAKDYSFEASGLKAGKNPVLFENDGQELHHVVALPIKSGASIDEVTKFVSSENSKGPPPFDEKNGVNTAVIDGGKKQLVELDLKKGKYALLCFITDRKGGPPHVAKGMVNETTVR